MSGVRKTGIFWGYIVMWIDMNSGPYIYTCFGVLGIILIMYQFRVIAPSGFLRCCWSEFPSIPADYQLITSGWPIGISEQKRSQIFCVSKSIKNLGDIFVCVRRYAKQFLIHLPTFSNPRPHEYSFTKYYSGTIGTEEGAKNWFYESIFFGLLKHL